MITLKVRITSDRIDAIRQRLPVATRALALRIAEDTAEQARTLAPVQTGRLRDSIGAEETSNGAAVTSDVPYAPLVEYGGHGRPPKPFMGQAAADIASRRTVDFDLERYLR